MVATIAADGSAQMDAHPTTEIDRESEPYRWVCPNGHTSWDRTNNHVWCPGCRNALDAGAMMKVHQAEHWELVDKKNDERIPYSAIEFAEDDD